MIRANLIALGCLAACGTFACSHDRVAPAVDLKARKAALLQRDHEWQLAVTEKKDAAKIAAFFTADAIMFGSGEPTVTGREALTKSIADLVAGPAFKDEWTWDRVELSPDGTLAYLVGTTNITTNDSSGHPATNHARLINVWRKDPDGVWRCVVDAWVDAPSARTSSGAGTAEGAARR
jgi:ketosteroid isomerase-like protein